MEFVLCLHVNFELHFPKRLPRINQEKNLQKVFFQFLVTVKAFRHRPATVILYQSNSPQLTTDTPQVSLSHMYEHNNIAMKC